MQTFVPLPSFKDSAASMDLSRLGKQIIEAQQIYKALTIPTYGWKNHPATKMWAGHEQGLVAYAKAFNDEWRQRRGKDHGGWLNLVKIAGGEGDPDDLPDWWGRDDVHESHRSNLIRKDAVHYTKLFPNTKENLPYAWPR
ncbi:MAG: MSMEG_6728 family protein [Actinobacteria bacterium]|nr:MSMEG_6728 family protein [Actinomycetota bacterium]